MLQIIRNGATGGTRMVTYWKTGDPVPYLPKDGIVTFRASHDELELVKRALLAFDLAILAALTDEGLCGAQTSNCEPEAEPIASCTPHKGLALWTIDKVLKDAFPDQHRRRQAIAALARAPYA